MALPPGFSDLAVYLTLLLLSLGLGFLHFSTLGMKTWVRLLGLGVLISHYATLPFDEMALPFAEYRWPMLLVILTSIPFIISSGIYERLERNQGLFLLMISTLHLGLNYLILKLSAAEQAHFFLAQLSVPALTIGAIIFICIVSIEPIHGVARATASSGPFRKNGLLNFLLFSLLYLGNLILFYLSKHTPLLTGFEGIEPLYFFIASFLIGLLQIRYFTESLGMWKDGQNGQSFFAGFAFFAMAGISWSFQDRNDALFEVLEDIILFSHMGLGFFMAIYIALNFATIYPSQVDFQKVLLKGRTFPFYMVYVGGLAILILLFLRSGKFPLYQAQGAYFAALASAYEEEGKNNFSRAFYERSAGFAYQNHKALYALAWDEYKKKRAHKAQVYLSQCKEGKSQPEDFLFAADLLEKNDKPFETLFQFRKGIKTHPNSVVLKNNLGLGFSKLNIGDSAEFYFRQAGGIGRENLAGLSILFQQNLLSERRNFDPEKANDWLLAYYDWLFPTPDQKYTGKSFPIAFNSSFFNAVKRPEKEVQELDSGWAKDPLNLANLELTRGIQFLRKGILDTAMIFFSDALRNGSSNKAYFNKVIARLYLSTGANAWASRLLWEEYSKGRLDDLDLLYYSLLKSKDLEKAAEVRSVLEKFGKSLDQEYKDFRAWSAIMKDPNSIEFLDSISDNEIREDALLNSYSDPRSQLSEGQLQDLLRENRIQVNAKQMEAVALRRLVRGDTLSFIDQIVYGSMGTEYFPLASSFLLERQGELENALQLAKKAYSNLPWEDLCTERYADLLIEKDQFEEAYFFLLDHVERFGRSTRISIALAKASLYYGIEPNLEVELEWLEQRMEKKDFEAAREELNKLKESLESWS